MIVRSAIWVTESKEWAYVTNVVSRYGQQLDQVLAARGWGRSSSGRSSVDFGPDVSKTLNRGYTAYFVNGRAEPPGVMDSPKMVGELVGEVMAVRGQSFVLDTDVELHSGDGLCWFDVDRELYGTVVNAVQADNDGVKVIPQEIGGVQAGLRIYRNHDHAFLRQVERSQPVRKMTVRLRLESTSEGFLLHAEDEDGNRTIGTLPTEKEPAQKPGKAEAIARKRLAKTGDTPFACASVELAWDQPYFVPVAVLNALRRETLDRLLAVRAVNRPVMQGEIRRSAATYPETALTYRGNALNQKAVAFYKRHGVQEIAPAAESGLDMDGEVVMWTRYCIQHQLGLCDGERKASDLREPLYLVDQDGHRYRLRFRCAECKMEVLY